MYLTYYLAVKVRGEKLLRVYKIDYINNNVPSINFNKNRKSREIVQFDLEGNFIKEWDSITDVDKFYENMNNKYILCNKKEGIFME